MSSGVARFDLRGRSRPRDIVAVLREPTIIVRRRKLHPHAPPFGRCRSIHPTPTLSGMEVEPAASATHESQGERPWEG